MWLSRVLIFDQQPPGHCADSGGLRNMMCWRRFEATSCELSYPLYSHITTEEDIRLDMFTCCQGFWSLTIQTNFQWLQIFAEICELWHHHMLSSTEIFIPGFTFHAKPRTIARGPLMFVQSSEKKGCMAVAPTWALVYWKWFVKVYTCCNAMVFKAIQSVPSATL